MTKRLMQLLDYKYTALYVALIPFVNWAFNHVPFYTLPDGSQFSVMYFVVGMIFVVRDFAQKEVGTKGFFIAFGIAALLSFWLANPALALASVIAFSISEVVDWAVFTFTDKPIHQRVIYSSLASVPVDTAIIMMGLSQIAPDVIGWNSFAILVTCKMAGAFVVAGIMWQRERRRRMAAA